MLLKPFINETEYESLPVTANSVERQSSTSFWSTLLWIILSLMGLVVVARSIMALSVGGGGDFYFYIVIAREWLQLPAGAPPSPMWFFYNPGIYRFYHALMLCGVTSAQGLAIAINSLNLINAALIAVILWRMRVHPILSLWAGIWSLFIVEHFDGFGGYTEPLVVMPILLSLAIAANPVHPWLQGRTLLIVGAGLALSLYAKQQGALYIFGAFFALLWMSNWRQRLWLKQASILASVAGGIFILLLAVEEGTLLEVLLPKINAVLTYPAKDASLWETLGGKNAADPKLGVLLIQLGAALLVLRFFNDGRRWLETPAGTMFALCAAMALASAWQVHTRPYKHYLLMTWPPLILAVAVGVHVALQHLGKTDLRRVASWAMLLILIIPFTRFTLRYGKMFLPGPVGVSVIDAGLESLGFVTIEPWFFPMPTIMLGAPLRTIDPLPSDVREALATLRQDLPERANVLVMPPHYTGMYWYLNLRHPLGDYGFPKADSAHRRDLHCAQTQAVFMLPNDKHFDAAWIEQAHAAGFVETRREGPVVLMRR